MSDKKLDDYMPKNISNLYKDWFLEYASQIGLDLRHRVLKEYTRHPDFEGEIGDSWVKKKCNVGIIKPALFEHQY